MHILRYKIPRLALVMRLAAGLIVGLYGATGFCAAKLASQSDGLVIYSGPGQQFRPLHVLSKGESVPVSPRIVSTPRGDFYKVLIHNGKSRRVGYLPVDAAVLRQRSEEEMNVEHYQSLSLAESSFQLSLNYLKQETYVWTAGYLKYPAPGFYLKGFVGQLFSLNSGGVLLGGEVGNESWVSGPYSVFALFASGLFFPAKDDQPFVGSESGLNIYLNGALGLRFNASEHASLSLGLGQTAVMNSNNSFLSLALMTTLEVGL